MKTQVTPMMKRAQERKYTPPPFKFNPGLERNVGPLLMDPEKTALLVIDVQNLFTEPGAPLAAPDGPSIIPHINNLVRYCRGANIPIVWVMETNRPDGSDLGMMGKYWTSMQDWLAPDSHLWQLYRELENKPTDIYVRKPKYNAFWGSDLEAVLRALNAESLIFTGICTDVCVGNTLIDAFHRDFNPVMAFDATTTFTPFKQEFLTRLELLFGRTLTVEEVIGELKALAP